MSTEEEAGSSHRSPTFLIPHRWRFLAALLLGAATVGGFAPFHLFPLPVLTLAGLFWLWSRASGPRAAALVGFAFGLGLFGAGASWIYVSLHDFGAMPAALASLATFLFCTLLALFPAAVGWLQARPLLAPFSRFALVVPALWALSDWSRAWVLTGFPWLAAGYSQVPASPLAGFAPLLGVFGVSLAVALSAGLLLLAADRRLPRPAGCGAAPRAWPALGLLAVLWFSGFALKQVDWTEPAGALLKVSLLQGNIQQDLKWRPERALATLDTYLRLARESGGTLVLLPETALPLFRHELPPEYLEALARRAKAAGGDLLVGMPELAGTREYYNSMVSLGASPTQVYRKHHLVPFGEFIPLRPLLGWVMDWLSIPLSDFSRGPAVQAPLAVAGQKVAVNICYEDVFGEEIIRQLPEATLLANVSNDAWFGRSLGPQQHLQIAQARALETGRYLLRATNTGVTAVIDPRGRVLARAPEFTTARIEAEVTGYAGATPYVRWGNWAVVLTCAALVVGAVAAAREHAGA
ncbi:MAG TPA: apolipoprotein N-acyltransferase [Burkholderiales bacterium]|nr:apolipoprotein N-acyltransferase [Burkholderiales bacterium]